MPHPTTSVARALATTREALAAAGLEEAPLEAELLLAHALGTDRASLLARLHQPLPGRARARLSSALARRLKREPLAYILGWRDFFGLRLAVRRGVMVPRPETETLVEEALHWAGRREGPIAVADIGTGSGCIAVAVALNLPRATLYAVDISPRALRVARENLLRHGLEGRVYLLRGDLLKPLPGPVDLIVANLPYIPRPALEGLQPEVRLHEPRRALDGGADGTLPARRLLAMAPAHLRPGGALMLEIDPSQRWALEASARRHFPGARLYCVPDLAGRDRVLVVDTSPTPPPPPSPPPRHAGSITGRPGPPPSGAGGG